MAPKAPKIPKKKKKNKNVKKASLDAVIQIAPMAGEIGEALMYGTGALGSGALGVMGNKARKLMKKGDAEYEKAVSGKRDGGMNAVPSKYEGFSKLPEGVQEKIDPKLAQKYKTGGMSKAVLKARGGTFKGTF